MRTEKWIKGEDTAMVDVSHLDVVAVSYPLFADLLRRLGWELVEEGE